VSLNDMRTSTMKKNVKETHFDYLNLIVKDVDLINGIDLNYSKAPIVMIVVID